MFRSELIETSIVGINAASQRAISVAPCQSSGQWITKGVLCDAGGDHLFFHPKFHYINIVLLLLFLLPITGSKAVCIANYETVTKPSLTYAQASTITAGPPAICSRRASDTQLLLARTGHKVLLLFFLGFFPNHGRL